MRWGEGGSGQWIQGGADLAQTASLSANKQGQHGPTATNSRHAARMAIGLGEVGAPARLAGWRCGSVWGRGGSAVGSSWWWWWWWCCFFVSSSCPSCTSRILANWRPPLSPLARLGCACPPAAGVAQLNRARRRNLRTADEFHAPGNSSEASADRYTANGRAWHGVIARHRSLAAVCARGKARPRCVARHAHTPAADHSESEHTQPPSLKPPVQRHTAAGSGSGPGTGSGTGTPPGLQGSRAPGLCHRHVDGLLLAALETCFFFLLKCALAYLRPSNAARADLAHSDVSSRSV